MRTEHHANQALADMIETRRQIAQTLGPRRAPAQVKRKPRGLIARLLGL